MRSAALMLAVMVALSLGLRADGPPPTLVLTCPPGSPDNQGCNPSKRDIKQARIAFSKAMDLQKQDRVDDAFHEFETAAQLSPRNFDYLTAREMVRQQLVSRDIQQGNQAMLAGKQIEALADFRSALQLDPNNVFAEQRVHDAAGESAPPVNETVRVVDSSDEIRVKPKTERIDFHYRGDSRELLDQVARAFGVTTEMDDSVVSRRVRFDIDDVDFYTAMRAACDVSKSFWTALAENQILVAGESPENHRQFDQMGMRTFYIPGATKPTDISDVVSLLRSVLEITRVTPHVENGTVTVRAPQNILEAATRLLQSLDDSRPQVMLDVRVYEISHTFLRNIGLQPPNNFNLYNIPAGALAALAGQNIQSLINQLISSGGINQASTSSLSSLLSQLQSQAGSIFSQPLATFGGGISLEGLSLGSLTAQLSLNESWSKALEHATVRASQGNDATFHMGSRYPVINASFAPIANSAAIAQVIGNQSYQAPVPSFTYEDLGLNIKARPTVNGNSDVSLQLELQFRSLAGQAVNGIPIIANREYKGGITLMNGEPAVVAGALSRTESKSLTGIPGFGAIPGLNLLTGANTSEVDDDELLIVLTPTVTTSNQRDSSGEIWVAR
jgi:type II secretory pathway component GspD/PulD (secretin)